jgi:hypothetical protein
MTEGRSPNLVAWQWGLYPAGHRDRANLLVHILTVPLFWAGTIALVASPLVSPYAALAGVVAMAAAMIAQGRGHAREHVAPVPFAGPFDVVTRIFTEQWVTFPRYVVSGAFARAFRRRSPGPGYSPEREP